MKIDGKKSNSNSCFERKRVSHFVSERVMFGYTFFSELTKIPYRH